MSVQKIDLAIEPQEAVANKKKPPLSFGLELIGDKRNLQVNIFSISENKGPAISDHLWKIKEHITREILASDHREKSWTLVRGSSFTDLDFEYRAGRPFKLKISDMLVLRDENAQPCGICPHDKCVSPDRHESLSSNQFRSSAAQPYELYCLNFSSVHAKSSLLYCVPPYLNSIDSRKDFLFILADPEKLLRRLSIDDQAIMEKPTSQVTMATERAAVSNITLFNPLVTGSFNYSKDDKLTLSTGTPSFFALAEKIGLAFIPIAVSEKIGRAQYVKLHEAIGHSQYGLPPAKEPPPIRARKINLG